MASVGGAGRWGAGWRDEAWEQLPGPWDVLVVGGGITGAGVVLEAAKRGLRAALVEKADFASGTSSRSGKLVHGGMRYLRHGRLDLTRALLRERDALLSGWPGLVEPLPFLLPTYRSHRRDRLMYGTAVRLYDLLRGRRRSWRRLSEQDVKQALPGVRPDALDGAYEYVDAVTDDARLVLRTLQKAVRLGSLVVSRVEVDELVREGGKVVGADVHDVVTGRSAVLRAALVVNATGVRADSLPGGSSGTANLRPIRGAHLVIPRKALPIASAVGFRHPRDGHYQYLVPWGNVVLLGTTHVDHPDATEGHAAVTGDELSYLLEGLDHQFPGAGIGAEDLVSSFAGVRPVVDSGATDPYREGRDSVVWVEDGLVTAITGKLTAFQSLAAQVLGRFPAAVARLGDADRVGGIGPEEVTAGLQPSDGPLASLSDAARRRLLGRYGPDAPSVLTDARDGELEPVADTEVLWAEVRWSARWEGVLHLDDLLLRRTALGLALPRGGEALFPRLERLCREELGWDAERWAQEAADYRRLVAGAYGVPEAIAEPDGEV